MSAGSAQGFLDLQLPEHLFYSLERAFERYQRSKAKAVEDAFFLIFGLAHLREWIAPGFKDERKRRAAATKAEEFFEAIFATDGYRLVLDLCNHAKHQTEPLPRTFKVQFGLPIDEWPDVLAVRSIDDGPPSGYSVDGRDLGEVFGEVLNFYKERWFDLTPDQRTG